MSERICKNLTCSYHDGDAGCLHPNACYPVVLDVAGSCEDYLKGTVYYLSKAFRALRSKNFIDFVEIDLDPELRICAYILTKAYSLGMYMSEWGTVRMLRFETTEATKMKPGHDDDRKRIEGNGLNADAIRDSIALDPEMTMRIEELLREGAADDTEMFRVLEHTPEKAHGSDDDKESIGVNCPWAGRYGWLAPDGTFTPADFGDHEESAQHIIEEKNWNDAFRRWCEEHSHISYLARDFLIDIKNYVLIHDPTGQTCMVTASPERNRTKAQKTFLFDYFLAMGDRFKANQYAD